MTLLRQLIIAITFLITCLLAGNLVVSVFNTRTYFYEQMRSLAEDTATSLGFTISHAAQEKDLAQINSMVDVIFDRGYYRRIVYLNLDGEAVVERGRPINIEGVPRWFVDFVKLPEPSGRAEVLSGWYRLGEVIVVGHPGYAYRDLWRVSREQFWLFVFTAVLSYGLAGLGLRLLLRPLRRVENQAEAICRREFPVQDKLPRTRELRRMVVAMNRMVKKTQAMFQEQVELSETLRRQAYLDPVTQLSNRRDFDARLEAYINAETGGSSGLLLLINIGNLQAFNDQFGRATGDQCLLELALALREYTGDYSKAILSRRGGADFCVFLPGLHREEVKQSVEQLHTTLRNLSWFDRQYGLRLHLGAAFAATVGPDHQLLSEADAALRQAQHRAVGWRLFTPPPGQRDLRARAAGQWRELLQEVLQERALLLHYQPVVDLNGHPVCVEVLCRLRDDGRILNAGVFLPMAERFNLSVAFDKLILELLLAQPHEDTAIDYCVNLSPRSIQDQGFRRWLGEFLRRHGRFAGRIVFEVPEQTLSLAEPAVREISALLQQCGAALSLDHFGAGGSNFSYLQSLHLKMLKIDRCFIQSIEQSADNQFFVKSLVQIAHSCDVRIFAEGVESAAEWQALSALGVDGGQGYHLGRPKQSIDGARAPGD
ncbi:EAL domain-containing protein [Exilibacterium tricleocarpae]|uniref:EAL domain-containing protein n=1 Tax=Exilibacterium tricleocarpae TaxID=2591008 RepID=A0A545T3D2_9GAMM|nr:EAL domain-containing protein [Exilibacterium tricleocarpae]TQV71723.1 EAL domain-containing protein [Exilibacterium tricleocarpae]